MPPLPMNAMISSWGKSLATSSTLGGWNGVGSDCVEVSASAPCLSRQAGQSPANAPSGSVAPHCGHFLGMFGSDSGVFIHPPQKRNRENVTGKMHADVSPQGESGKQFTNRDFTVEHNFRFASEVSLRRL